MGININTMDAWRYSSPRRLEHNITLDPSAPFPPPAGPHEVKVMVFSAALNPADLKVPEMPVVGRLLAPPPASPGMDFAGCVVSAGNAVLPSERFFRAGQLVYGTLGIPSKFGSLGQFVVCNAEHVVTLEDEEEEKKKGTE